MIKFSKIIDEFLKLMYIIKLFNPVMLYIKVVQTRAKYFFGRLKFLKQQKNYLWKINHLAYINYKFSRKGDA